jgi:hypothetical protein
MQEIQAGITYFPKAGRENTQQVLALAQERIDALGIRKALVATTTGETAALAVSRLRHCEVIAVTHSTGFRTPNEQEIIFEHRALIESSGGKVLTAQHAMGGINRAIRRKMDTFQPDEIIANTLRIFGQGMKVVFEICLMAADAGLVRTDDHVMCIAGSGRGADTAVVMKPANAQDFFDLQVIEVVCLPSPLHPQFS